MMRIRSTGWLSLLLFFSMFPTANPLPHDDLYKMYQTLSDSWIAQLTSTLSGITIPILLHKNEIDEINQHLENSEIYHHTFLVTTAVTLITRAVLSETPLKLPHGLVGAFFGNFFVKGIIKRYKHALQQLQEADHQKMPYAIEYARQFLIISDSTVIDNIAYSAIPGDCQQLINGLRDTTINEAIISGNILFFGPSGMGKTTIARYIAHTTDCLFFAVSASQLHGVYQHETAKRLQLLLQGATDLARKLQKKAIIFIDEIDAILGHRTVGNIPIQENISTVDTFLSLTDGFSTAQNRDTALIIGATNKKEMIDEAALNRFTYKIYVGLPTNEQAKAFITHYVETHDQPDISLDMIMHYCMNLPLRAIQNALDKAYLTASSQQTVVTTEQICTCLRHEQREQQGTQITSRPVINEAAAIAFAQQFLMVTSTQFPIVENVLPPSVTAFIKALKNRETFQQYYPDTASMNLLLFGPPGTGKTTIARHIAQLGDYLFFGTTAGQLQSSFHHETSTHIIQLVVGAIAYARSHHKKAIVFIDEIDSLLSSRHANMTATSQDNNATVTAFLSMIDGFSQADREYLILIGATNRSDMLDASVLNRFNYKIRVDNPTESQIRAYIAHEIAQRPMARTLENTVEELVALCKDLSLRSIRNVFDKAAMAAFNANKPMGIHHITHAAQRERAHTAEPAKPAITFG